MGVAFRIGSAQNGKRECSARQFIFEPFEHPRAEVFAVADAVLHERYVRVREQIQIHGALARGPAVDADVSEIALEPDLRRERIGVADDEAPRAGGVRIFATLLLARDMDELRGGPTIRGMDVSCLRSVYSRPYSGTHGASNVSDKSEHSTVFPVDSGPSTQIRRARYVRTGGVNHRK